MKILLFTLACVIVLFWIRLTQRSRAPRETGGVASKRRATPAADPGEVVDVPFVDLHDGEKEEER